MARRYYSSRTKASKLTLEELYLKLQNLYLLFRNRDYFKEKIGITEQHLPDEAKHAAGVALRLQPFPITKWGPAQIDEDRVFDTIEFLYDQISKPGTLVDMVSDTGFNYQGYESYDERRGRAEYRETVNTFLVDYGSGFELTGEGNIVAMGQPGLQQLFAAEIPVYDEKNVDSKVRYAIAKWRDRSSSATDRREAVRELADVFEWLKKSKRLEKVLADRDESMLFEIANKFAIRHHDPSQKSNYDATIWHSWMFHFYLATYHAVIRLLVKGKR